MKREVDALFRDAERLLPSPDLWRRIAGRSPLLPEGSPAPLPRFAWGEAPYLRAAAVILAAGLLALAAFGWLRNPGGGTSRETSATLATAEAASGTAVIDPELLGWQADLGVFESEAGEAGEVL